MALVGIMPSEMSQTEKDKYCTISLTGGLLKQNKTKTKLTEKEIRFMVTSSGGWGKEGIGDHQKV